MSLVPDHWEPKYLYYLLFAAAIITFILPQTTNEKIIVPWIPLMFFLLFLMAVASGMFWLAISKSGSLSITTMGLGKGSSEGVNLMGDILIASSKNQPSLACMAQGGFAWAGFCVSGKKRYIICPPEHLEWIGGNVVCKTNLGRVKFSELQRYVQAKLVQLPGFKETKVVKMDNIYFGLTSSYYGTDTAENIKLEESQLAKTAMGSEYKTMLEEMIEKKLPKEPEERKSIIKQITSEEEEQ